MLEDRGGQGIRITHACTGRLAAPSAGEATSRCAAGSLMMFLGRKRCPRQVNAEITLMNWEVSKAQIGAKSRQRRYAGYVVGTKLQLKEVCCHLLWVIHG